MSRIEGSQEVMRARLSDGAVRQITATPRREEAWPYWSERAQRLVFQVTDGATGSDLMLWSPDGIETRLTDTPRREERWPQWSPREPRLVYAFRGGKPASGLATAFLARDEPVHTGLVAQGGPTDIFLRPKFAPRGTRLVVQRRGPDGLGSNLWLIVAGASPRRLTRDPAWFDFKASFTREGTRIVYSRRPLAGGSSEIAILHVKGGEPRRLIASDKSDAHAAQASPTRDEFAFVSHRNGKAEVFLANLDGGVARRLTHSRARRDYAPRWSPDGDRIVVLASPSDIPEPHRSDRASFGATRVVVLDREGSVLFEAPGSMASWMPPWP